MAYPGVQLVPRERGGHLYVNQVQILSVPVHCFGSDLAPDPREYDSPSRKPRTKACYLHASVLTFGVQHAPPRYPASGARNPGEKVSPTPVSLASFLGIRHKASWFKGSASS